MRIEYFRKQNYGVTMFYVLDKKLASVVQKLTGKKTLTFDIVNALKELGHEVVEVLPPDLRDVVYS
jgi:hypothetical protein